VTIVVGSMPARVKTSVAYRHFREWAVAEGYSEATLHRVNAFVQRLVGAAKGSKASATARADTWSA